MQASFCAEVFPVLAVQKFLQLSVLKLDPCWHQASCWFLAQVPSRLPFPPAVWQVPSLYIRSPWLHQFCRTDWQFNPPALALLHSALLS